MSGGQRGGRSGRKPSGCGGTGGEGRPGGLRFPMAATGLPQPAPSRAGRGEPASAALRCAALLPLTRRRARQKGRGAEKTRRPRRQRALGGERQREPRAAPRAVPRAAAVRPPPHGGTFIRRGWEGAGERPPLSPAPGSARLYVFRLFSSRERLCPRPAAFSHRASSPGETRGPQAPARHRGAVLRPR